jgi:heat shock protein HspQ
MNKKAKFNLGDRVIHKRHGYRAVIIDVDPYFRASGRYNPQALKREFATRHPWYRLLVDGYSHMTYVEECLLKTDPHTQTINNPQLGRYLHEIHGKYHSNMSRH